MTQKRKVQDTYNWIPIPEDMHASWGKMIRTVEEIWKAGASTNTRIRVTLEPFMLSIYYGNVCFYWDYFDLDHDDEETFSVDIHVEQFVAMADSPNMGMFAMAFSREEQVIIFRQSRSVTKIQWLEPIGKEIPVSANYAPISREVLYEGLKRASVSANKNDPREIASAVFLQALEKGNIAFYSMNGYTLAHEVFLCDHGWAPGTILSIHAGMIPTILAFLKPDKADTQSLHLCSEGGILSLNIGASILQVPSMSTTFDPRPFLQTRTLNKNGFSFDRKEMLQAVAQCSGVSKLKSSEESLLPVVLFCIEEDWTPEPGDTHELYPTKAPVLIMAVISKNYKSIQRVSGKWTGKQPCTPERVLLNLKNLSSMLKNMNNDQLVMTWPDEKGSGSPVFIEPLAFEKEGGMISGLSPIRPTGAYVDFGPDDIEGL